MTARRWMALAVCAAFTPGVTAGAQDWRTTESARQLHDSGAYDVQVRYAAGQLELAPAEAPMLYRMRLHYDADRAHAVHSLEGRTLTLGVDRTSGVWRGARGGEESRMHVALSPAVPIDLHLELGAAKALLDVGDLSLTALRVDAGASDTRIIFGAPNRVAMRELTINTGAANVELVSLANANAEAIEVKTAVGNVELDFGGRWTRDVAVSVDMAVGSLEVTVPRDVGVRVEVGRVLTRVSTPGFTARDGGLVSEEWDTAAHKLTLRVKTVLGSVDVKRGSR